jgi:uncharacterized protein
MTGTRAIFHLSFPVRDLQEAIDFYSANFGAVPGRREADWADIALFDAQVTLQHDPANVASPMPRTRHFGATMTWEGWEALTTRLSDRVTFVKQPTLSYVGTDREQGKAMVADPSGNLIEVKAYRNPQAVLGLLGQAD